MLGGPARLVVDIDDPDLYYISTVQGAGLAAIKNGEILNTFTYQDLGFDLFWLDSFIDARIDNDGNLWVGHANAKTSKIYAVLPSAKRKNLASVKKDDWHIVSLPADFTATRDLHFTFCKKSNYYFSGSGLTHGILIIDNNGTPSNFNDDKSLWQKNICDEAGNVLDPASITSIVEDENGHVWCGTDIGVFVITDFSGVMKSTLTVKRPIVARNDGTNLGDYLLDGEGVYQIAVDHSNRKWFASQTSGVYLTNADGTEILNHYTTDNSPLPSNCVYAVACDPHSNKVYFATKSGLVAYDSDSSPAADDFSEVYAYPNPVRPEYTGWITVAGLMDNSLVKIADAAGNVFFQGRSEGGMIAWDGCDPSGKRVRSGVYFVFASNSESGSSSSCVTKIMVIN